MTWRTNDTLSTTDCDYEVVIAAPAAEVWAGIVESDRVERWFFDNSLSTDWAIGSPIHYLAHDGTVDIAGIITSYDEPNSWSMTFEAHWSSDGTEKVAPAGEVTWTVTDEGGLTRVCLDHTGIPGGFERAQEVAAGWPYLLSNLKTYVETGSPMRARVTPFDDE
jgi:uncharacterized protein YndB with AHSA1/START domain